MTGIIIYKIETFVIMMLLGVLAARLHILKKDGLSTLSGLLVKITFPCLPFRRRRKEWDSRDRNG